MVEALQGPKGRVVTKGKEKDKKGTGPPVPSELRGKWHKIPAGDPIRYGFNCKSGCSEKVGASLRVVGN